MEVTRTHNTQVTLPTELYQAIEQRARMKGRSINSEIVELLAVSLSEDSEYFTSEFSAWEAASDEDWLNMETSLASEAP